LFEVVERVIQRSHIPSLSESSALKVIEWCIEGIEDYINMGKVVIKILSNVSKERLKKYISFPSGK